MSQSFPSSNGWEPFSNSQQQHALGWRRPATKPALPAPPNPTAPRIPAISPWNHINRPSRTDPPSLNQPTPSPHDDLALSTAVTKQEHQHDTRYNALKSDIAAVDSKLVQVQSDIDDIRQKSQDSEKLITTDLRRIYDQCRDLHHAVRAQSSAHDDHARVCDVQLRRLDQHLKSLHTTDQTDLAHSLQIDLSNAIDDKIKAALDAATHRLTQHITYTVHTLKTVMRTSTTPNQLTPPLQSQHTASKAPPPFPISTPREPRTHSRRHDAHTLHHSSSHPTRVHSPIPLVLRIHSSEEEYALRVANRKRPPKPPSSSSYQEADSLDPRHMYASDASTQDPAEVQCVEDPPQPQPRCLTPQNHDSSMGLFEDSHDSFDSPVSRLNRFYAQKGSYGPESSPRGHEGISKLHRRSCRQSKRLKSTGINSMSNVAGHGQGESKLPHRRNPPRT